MEKFFLEVEKLNQFLKRSLKIAQKGLLQGDLRKEKGGEKNSQKRG